MTNRLFTFAMVLLASMTFAASASAATRYASPTVTVPTDLACPISEPCDLTTAVNDTAYGDEVILLSGTYDVTPTAANVPGISTAQDVTIRGESPFSPPLIRSTPTELARGFVVNYGVTLRDVRISYLGAFATNIALYGGQFATVERVYVDSGPTQMAACSALNGTVLVNTTCLARNVGTIGLEFSLGMNTDLPLTWDFEVTIRNSTIVALGEFARAVRVSPSNQGTSTHNHRIVSVNSILRALGSSSNDVELSNNYGANNTAELVAQNSNYSTVTTTGSGAHTFTANTTNGNQAAAPVFTNLAAGDVSQAASSPTIDAGIDDPANGTLDLAAKPRTAGVRTDIGAYEFQPPAVPNVPAAKNDLSALTAAPARFRAAAKGSTLRPASTRPKTKRGQKPIGSLLAFRSTDAGELRLHAFQILKGRRSKAGKCGKPSRANARGKRCTYHKRLSRTATAAITPGLNRFYFTGRWNSKKLRPGRYLLVAKHAGKGTSVPSPTVAEAGVARRSVTIVR